MKNEIRLAKLFIYGITNITNELVAVALWYQ